MQRMLLDRRVFLTACTRAGIASPLLPGILYTLAAQAQDAAPGTAPAPAKITPEMIDQAALLAGVGPFTDDQKKMMLDGLNGQRGRLRADSRAEDGQLRGAGVCVSSAAGGDGGALPSAGQPGFCRAALRERRLPRPAQIEDVAFATVAELGALLRERKITSLALTQMYLDRLKRYDPKLHFVITLTEERALAQAKAADAEIAAGKYRGPLHGIPWGAKDLLAVKGYPTTWGAGGFEHQMFDEDATVVQRLDAAGAVLVAKLTLGALAMGDKWFGGQTRNPWNPAQGSSGSSAGPA